MGLGYWYILNFQMIVRYNLFVFLFFFFSFLLLQIMFRKASSSSGASIKSASKGGFIQAFPHLFFEETPKKTRVRSK